MLERNHATADRARRQDRAARRRRRSATRFPWLNTDDLAGGAFGLANEGWTDPYSLLQAFRRKARRLGVRYLKDEVAGLERAGERIAAVTLASGERIACGALVNTRRHRCARGSPPWPASSCRCGRASASSYVFDCRAPIQQAPLLIDPTGVYFRPEGANYICGVSPAEANDPDCTDFEIDYGLFEEVVWPTLAHRVPAFEAIKLVRAWAGHYDYNTLDQNAILGRVPGLENFYFANGFSGHGLQQSPAVGRAIAELIVHGAYRSIDLTRFGYERVLANRPLAELNVV